MRCLPLLWLVKMQIADYETDFKSINQKTIFYMITALINTIPLINKNPFASFWMGGYECTDKLNAFGNRVDFLTSPGIYKCWKKTTGN